MAEFEYQDLLPVGHHDDTPFRLLTADGVATIDAGGRRFLQVEPEALTALTKQAMFDIAHLLRGGEPYKSSFVDEVRTLHRLRVGHGARARTAVAAVERAFALRRRVRPRT